MEDFLKLMREKYDIASSRQVEQAYKLAKIAHAGNIRKSGEPWFNHCVSVAKILLELNMDADTVCAGLLHDALDDTDITLKQISDAVGTAVSDLCKGLSKVNGIKYGKSNIDEVESLRRLIIAMGKDIRVIIIKLADRVHNMRTIEFLPRERQIKYATETQEVFSGLAERLGLSTFKRELDDLCFKTLNPEEYTKLNPQNLIGEPKDVAEAICFLCDENNKYINGSFLAVDGGESISSYLPEEIKYKRK